jgi:hypothetical protein
MIFIGIIITLIFVWTISIEMQLANIIKVLNEITKKIK